MTFVTTHTFVNIMVENNLKWTNKIQLDASDKTCPGIWLNVINSHHSGSLIAESAKLSTAFESHTVLFAKRNLFYND